MPWGFLFLFGLLTVAAVGLLIYFMTRVRKSEKDAEEDWGFSRRGILLNPSVVDAADVKKSEAPPEALPLPKESKPPVIASQIGEPIIAEPMSVVKRPGPPQPQVSGKTGPQVDSAEAAGVIRRPARDQQPSLEQQQEEMVALGKPQLQPADQGSPFDEEIWTQLQSPPVVVRETEVKLPPAGVAGHRERYAPPRIDPIVPLSNQAQKADLPLPETGHPQLDVQPPAAGQAQRVDLPRPEISLSLSASQQSPASRPRLDARAPVSKSPRPAPSGSILGLPAEASAGPLVIDRRRAVRDAVAVGTLANYDNLPDDAAGHSGTVALVTVIVLVCGLLAAYLTISSVHTRVDNWVAWVRGVHEPAKSVAQVFPSTLDESKDPADAKGSLQNISDHSLSNLMVIISLDPRGGGAAVNQDVQVTPDEILPGQQGTYEFQIERNKYRSYKVVGLKSKDGAMLPCDKVSQQQ